MRVSRLRFYILIKFMLTRKMPHRALDRCIWKNPISGLKRQMRLPGAWGALQLTRIDLAYIFPKNDMEAL